MVKWFYLKLNNGLEVYPYQQKGLMDGIVAAA